MKKVIKKVGRKVSKKKIVKKITKKITKKVSKKKTKKRTTKRKPKLYVLAIRSYRDGAPVTSLFEFQDKKMMQLTQKDAIAAGFETLVGTRA